MTIATGFMILIGFTAIGIFLFTDVDPLVSREERMFWRSKASELTSELHVGMSRQQVNTILASYGWSNIKKEDNEIRIWTPPELRAGNWIIRITFDQDELRSVRFGTADNIYKRPEGAPPDIF